jgi:hypothetical protein
LALASTVLAKAEVLSLMVLAKAVVLLSSLKVLVEAEVILAEVKELLSTDLESNVMNLFATRQFGFFIIRKTSVTGKLFLFSSYL